MVEVDEFSNLGLYWNRLIFLKSRPAVVSPLVSDLELSAPAMACDMPWYVCLCIGTQFKALHVRMYICMYVCMMIYECTVCTVCSVRICQQDLRMYM